MERAKKKIFFNNFEAFSFCIIPRKIKDVRRKLTLELIDYRKLRKLISSQRIFERKLRNCNLQIVLMSHGVNEEYLIIRDNNVNKDFRRTSPADTVKEDMSLKIRIVIIFPA